MKVEMRNEEILVTSFNTKVDFSYLLTHLFMGRSAEDILAAILIQLKDTKLLSELLNDTITLKKELNDNPILTDKEKLDMEKEITNLTTYYNSIHPYWYNLTFHIYRDNLTNTLIPHLETYKVDDEYWPKMMTLYKSLRDYKEDNPDVIVPSRIKWRK
jgi:hypothetical protein